MTRPLPASLAVAALLVVAGCLGALPAGEQTGAAENRTATVVEVVDGDTVDVRFADGATDTVRLLGVDSPEVYDDVSTGEFEGVPDSEAGRECLRAWGERASDYAVDQLDGETVTVVFDAESDRRGGYDRLLAYVHVDGESFNRALLRAGYARLYDSEFTQRDDFAALEQRAQRNATGLWSCAS